MRSCAWLVIGLTLLAPGTALARDHLELVCSGVVASPKDGGERIALMFHFFESRARDGTSRDEWLSTIYQNKLFQAHHLHKEDKKEVGVVMRHGKQIRFRGTYAFDNNAGRGPYTLRVVGNVNEDPTAKKPVYRVVDETLACVDLSI